MRLKLDMHVHTTYSRDGLSDVKSILIRAKKIGLDGIAITDHNTCDGLSEAIKIAEKLSLLLIRGQEVRCKEGDMLIYGLDFPVPKGLSAAETLDIVHENGGIGVVAHPFGYLFHSRSCGGNKIMISGVDGVEVFNSRSVVGNWKALMLAKKHNLAALAGSDAHHWCEVGNAYTVVECDERDEVSVLNALRAGRTIIRGSKTHPARILRWYVQRLIRSSSHFF